ncbi:MAG TPA: hypothetical protein PKD04_08035 [Rhodocyclaceae bacterium]|jgi:hypothetical protein|nr:hypothetical protein [Rhodocyclaceae bacterium]HMV22465.1 hypothetical protein [Rhodocyclaceae bacterium]HMW77898.1 hypothetical protein [Rhodocyclaceae bacterium]HNE42392.1 hypothetical protein [Rhodocyclaceae bacterium]HNL21667.1 hypothetical protein [Rhodocyclaceae bacterium]
MADKLSQPEFIAGSAWRVLLPPKERLRHEMPATADKIRSRGPEIDYDITACQQGAWF